MWFGQESGDADSFGKRTIWAAKAKEESCRQKMHKVIKWLAYGPKISRGLGHDQGCPAAIAFIYHHTTLPLASFRGFGLLCGFLRKTTVEQNKDSWISLSGNKSLLGLAAMLIQYLLQLLPGESVFAECGSNRFCKTKYCTFDCYGWQFFCQVSTGREYRVLHREPDLRHFVLLPGGVCVSPWAAQCRLVKFFFY